jgi:hypothetical protein
LPLPASKLQQGHSHCRLRPQCNAAILAANLKAAQL